MRAGERSRRPSPPGRRARGAAPARAGTAHPCACPGPVGRTRHDWCVVFQVGEGRHRLWGNALFSHASIGVNLLGGTRPHIGAVAVAIPRTGPGRRGRRGATTSVFTVVGHRDDEVARPVAAALARDLGVTVVVTAGVHLPRARPADIALVLRNTQGVISVIQATAKSARQRTRRPEWTRSTQGLEGC